MKIPEKLKLNKFKAVRIPSKSEYFAKFGEINGYSKFTGDDTPPELGRKTDNTAQAIEDLERWQKENAKPQE